MTTEYGPFAITLSVLAWVFVNCFLLVVLQRPAVCAALALTFIVILIALSHFKFGILQLTLTFLDFLIIDRDTFSFLLSVFPRLQLQLVLAGLVAVPLLWLVWRFDPFRVRRRFALTGVAATAALISAMAVASPEQAWEPFQGVNHISNLARSGVVAVSRLASTGWIEADPPANGPLSLARDARAAGHPVLPPATACDATAKRPHIIMLLDESSFDVTSAPGIKVPAGYTDYFKSSDGKQRTMIAESTGGPTWYTEFNVLTGLSARSFGDLKFYVTRIAAGRVTRGLPQALQRCGYKTVSLYPTYGDFLSARAFQKGTGVGAVHRHGRDGRERGHAAGQVLFRSGIEGVCARAAAAVAGLHVRLPHGQSFSLVERLSAGSDARGLDAAGQHRRGRRVHSSPGHDGTTTIANSPSG